MFFGQLIFFQDVKRRKLELVKLYASRLDKHLIQTREAIFNNGWSDIDESLKRRQESVIFRSVRDIAVSTNCEWMHRIAVSHASKKIVDRSLWVTGMPVPATFRFRPFGERLAKVQRIPFVVHRVGAPTFRFLGQVRRVW